MKQSVARRAISWLKKNAPEYLQQMEDVQPNGEIKYRLWQRGGGFDRNLRSIRDVREKIAYIHQNPVRRGLVEREADWHWSSAVAWTTGMDEPIGYSTFRSIQAANMETQWPTLLL